MFIFIFFLLYFGCFNSVDVVDTCILNLPSDVDVVSSKSENLDLSDFSVDKVSKTPFLYKLFSKVLFYGSLGYISFFIASYFDGNFLSTFVGLLSITKSLSQVYMYLESFT